MNIQYFVRQVYGNTTYYIADKEQAQAWYALTGNETVTEKKAEAAKQLGISFEKVPDPSRKGL